MNAQTRRYLLARAQQAAEEFPAAIEPPLALGLRRYRARLIRVFTASLVLAVIVFGAVISVHPTTVAALETLFPASSTSEATLLEISVTPGELTVQVGEQAQLTAQGRYSDDTTADLEAEVTWTSADPDVVGVDDSGLVSAESPGTTVITAALGTVQGSSAVTVLAPGAPPPVAPDDPDPSEPKTQTGVTIIPESVTLAPQETQQLVVQAVFSDGTTAAVEGTPQWDSDEDRIARVDETGLLTAGPFGDQAGQLINLQARKVTVWAELDGFRAPAAVIVDPLKNATITVTGARKVNPGDTLRLAAAVEGVPNLKKVTGFSWSSSDDSVARVDGSGLVTAGEVDEEDSAVITASWRQLEGSATVTVVVPTEVE